MGGGGGPRQSDKKNSDSVVCLFFFFLLFFLSPLAYFTEVKWLISKRNIIFQGSGGGPNFSRGGGGGGVGGQLLSPYGNPNNLRFSRGVRTTWPLPSGSALGCDLFSFPVRKMVRSPLGLHMCLLSCNFVVCFQSSPAIKSFLELTA